MTNRFPVLKRRRQAGYALLLVTFLTTLLLLTTIAVAPVIKTERQREKEAEMVWRGKQYVRAIKLYYRKNGKFPNTIDDLTEPKQGSLRYLRQAYKDPMNKEDGSWRLIYVGPSGQLIGSTKPAQSIGFGAAGAAGGGQLGTPAGASGGGFSSIFGANGNPAQGAQGSQLGGPTPGAAAGTTQTATGQPGTGQPGTDNGTGTGTDANTGLTPGAPAPVDTSNFVGGNIIGIGSKVKQPSMMIYEKAKNYYQFEFIWDPSKDTMAVGGTGTQMGNPTGAAVPPGQGFGQGFGQGIGPGAGTGTGSFGSQPSTSPQPTGNPAPAQPGGPPLSTPPQ
jgi:hypothetical protein